MSTKHVTICIPVDVYARVKKLAPQKKWETNNIQEFYTQIFLDGLEHPRFLKKEHQLAIRKLEVEKSIVQGQLTAAQKQLPGTPSRPSLSAVSNVAEQIARTFEGLPNPRPQAEASAPASTTEPVQPQKAPEPEVAPTTPSTAVH
jgi:hypothetical protein